MVLYQGGFCCLIVSKFVRFIMMKEELVFVLVQQTHSLLLLSSICVRFSRTIESIFHPRFSVRERNRWRRRSLRTPYFRGIIKISYCTETLSSTPVKTSRLMLIVELFAFL